MVEASINPRLCFPLKLIKSQQTYQSLLESSQPQSSTNHFAIYLSSQISICNQNLPQVTIHCPISSYLIYQDHVLFKRTSPFHLASPYQTVNAYVSFFIFLVPEKPNFPDEEVKVL